MNTFESYSKYVSRCESLIGQRFGMLTILDIGQSDKKGHSRWFCLCDCACFCEVGGKNLRTGHTTSCGCLGRSKLELRTTHGNTIGARHTSEYSARHQAKQRCFNPKTKQWQDYGGRGITMCDRWRDSFEAFLEDMGPRPPKTSIDRKNNGGNYEPGNCRWATKKEQQRNMRTNVLVTIEGVTRCLSEWSEISGIARSTLVKRLQKGNALSELLIPPAGRAR